MLCGTNLGGSPASVDADEASPGLLSTRSRVTVRAQHIIRASLIALLSIVGAVPAFAEDTHRLSIECSHGSTADQRIAGCSHLISSGYLDARALVEAFHNRGNAYDDKGQYERAIDDYNCALAIDPTAAGLYNDRGTAHQAMGRYDMAIQNYARALSLEPSNTLALNNRCFARAVIGQAEQGLTDCNESLRFRPGDARAHAARGFAHARLQQYEAAIADYDVALRLIPRDPYALFGRGIAKRLRGDLPAGNADIAAGRAIKPDVAEDMEKLGLTP